MSALTFLITEISSTQTERIGFEHLKLNRIQYLSTVPPCYTGVIRLLKSRNSHSPAAECLLISVMHHRKNRGNVKMQEGKMTELNEKLMIYSTPYPEYLSLPFCLDAQMNHRLHCLLKAILCKTFNKQFLLVRITNKI